jgi:uncharacterized BrkB/YihY/UPF0761 family membrane protein
MRARADHVAKQIEGARPRFTLLDLGLRTYERDRTVGGNLLAGALAFRTFLWLVPFVFVLVAGLGFASASGSASPDQIEHDFGVSGYVAQQIASVASQAQRGRWLTLAIGLAALFGASRSAATGLRAVHAIAWRLPPLGLRRRTRAGLVFMAGGTVLVGASVGANWLRTRSAAYGLAAILLLLLVYSSIWLAASIMLPHRDAPVGALVPGAILFGLGVEAMQLFTALWLVNRIRGASSTYGALGVAVVILGALYVFGRLVVASAMLNASRWDRRRAQAGADADQALPAES